MAYIWFFGRRRKFSTIFGVCLVIDTLRIDILASLQESKTGSSSSWKRRESLFSAVAVHGVTDVVVHSSVCLPSQITTIARPSPPLHRLRYNTGAVLSPLPQMRQRHKRFEPIKSDMKDTDLSREHAVLEGSAR